jgi:HD superfamily phosphodiesterase
MATVLSKGELNKIIAFARRKCNSNDFVHRSDHMELTVRIADFLARREHADVEICVVAAYFHDLGRQIIKNKHGLIGARIARGFLKKLKLPRIFINAVCYTVAQHDTGSPKRTREAKVLWDADKLQSVGPLGFLRIYSHYLMFERYDIYTATHRTKKLQDFFYQRFQTKSGKILAKKLHFFMRDFYVFLDLIKNIKVPATRTPQLLTP